MRKNTRLYAKKLNSIVLTCSLLLCGFMHSTKVQAATTQKIEPDKNQHFTMRATDINEIEGQGRQVIMELWGYDIDFKRI